MSSTSTFFVKNFIFSSVRIFVFLFSPLLILEYSQDLQANNNAPEMSCPSAVDSLVDLSSKIVLMNDRGTHC